MTADQQATLTKELREMLAEHRDEEFLGHHGDAKGADAQFHAICQNLGISLVIHPSRDQKDRAFCQGAMAEQPPAEFRQQSEAIVSATEILIATPDGFREKLRSGTWMTVRVARKAQKTIVFCYPDGVRETEIED
jgi:hypothetical protein